MLEELIQFEKTMMERHYVGLKQMVQLTKFMNSNKICKTIRTQLKIIHDKKAYRKNDAIELRKLLGVPQKINLRKKPIVINTINSFSNTINSFNETKNDDDDIKYIKSKKQQNDELVDNMYAENEMNAKNIVTIKSNKTNNNEGYLEKMTDENIIVTENILDHECYDYTKYDNKNNKGYIEELKDDELENLENLLDDKCQKYNKYNNNNNPAEYITYNATKKLYVLPKINNNKGVTSKQLNDVTEKRKERIIRDFTNGISKISYVRKWKKSVIHYNGERVIVYILNNTEFYFDINHAMNLLSDLESTDHIYSRYKENITNISIKDNAHGGFYVKEFIHNKILTKILMTSNSEFAKRFKDNIADILDELSKKQLLKINNNGDLVLNLKQNNCDILQNNLLNICANDELVKNVCDLIKKHRCVNWNLYAQKDVMYFCITTIKHPKYPNMIISKIGFSNDVFRRMPELEGDYKCKFYFIGFKYVNGEGDEKALHTLLKTHYKIFPLEINVGGKDRKELYKFDYDLCEVYTNYEDSSNFELNCGKTTELINFGTQVHDKLIEQNNEKYNMLKLEHDVALQKLDKEIELKRIESEKEIKSKQITAEIEIKRIDTEKEIKLKQMEHEITMLKLRCELKIAN